MERLWAPWRMAYVGVPRGEECVFCESPRRGDDRAARILHRSAQSYVIMNIYPYTNGHLMVVPFPHEESFETLAPEVLADLWVTVRLSVAALRAVYKPDGFNIGMNLGRDAGAGIGQHLHIHIVPRWRGDTDLMPILGETKVIPDHIDSTYEKLLPKFPG
ncbi:MAG: HIT family hydrolase [Nitrospirae bacterium RBG_16_64_22]|nr:MAG: HIT family hydrolase [Nitrospirae bacterium RBG_16_64_22]